MELKELKTKKESELQKLLRETRGKLMDLKFKVASKQLKNIREVRVTKKLIANILTLLNAGRGVEKKEEKN